MKLDIGDIFNYTGLISSMSEGKLIPPHSDNPFRQAAIERDFQKVMLEDLRTAGKYDYVILDFLDERFDIAEISGSCYTKSEVFDECSIPFSYKVLPRSDSEMIKLWESKCLEFITVLKERFPEQNIILVKNYLTGVYKTDTDLVEFDNAEEVRQQNIIIDGCYEFFEANYPGIKVIEVNDSSLLFTDEGFRHGCTPWHYNTNYYNDIRTQIASYVYEGGAG